MAADLERISSGFLHALEAPAGPLMRTAVQVWMRKEGLSSNTRNNPWNLHGGAPCEHPSHRCEGGGTHKGQIARAFVSIDDQNVAIFATLDDGIAASAANLVNLGKKDKSTRYEAVVAAARAGDPVRFLNALAVSKWSANRYGTKNGGENALINIWNDLTGRHDDPLSYKTPGPGPIIEEDELDARKHIPVAVCDVAGPISVYGDSGRRTVLIETWPGATKVGLYATALSPLDGTKASLVPIRIDLIGPAADDLRVGWVGIDRVSNIRLP
jgi:hypothetical protein